MPLDEGSEALLVVFCHCYEKLLGYLDALDDAAQSHYGWSAYRIVKVCFNSATRSRGSEEIKTLDHSSLCSDFLSRVEGFARGELGPDSPVLPILAEYRAAVHDWPIPTQVDLTSWQLVGEELSRECYRSLLPADSPNLARQVRAVRTEPSGKQRVVCEPHKDMGESKITFYFAPPQFVLQSYVNLPFYFFHEYFSHIHTASLFAERDEVPKPFEDGWLLCLAHDFYRHRLLDCPHPDLDHHSHYLHYANQYVQDQLDDETNQPWVPQGYERAKSFSEVVGNDLHQRTSLLVAISPHDHFPTMPGGLHYKFVHRAHQWLEHVKTQSREEKETLLQRLATLLEGSDPIRELFEFLIE